MKELKIIEHPMREALEACISDDMQENKAKHCKRSLGYLLDMQAYVSYQQGREEAIKEVKEELLSVLNHNDKCKHPYAHCGTEFSDIRLGFDRACREVEEVINSIH